MRADGGAIAEGFFPAGLEGGLEVVAHPVGDVGVEPAHAGHLMAEALLGEDLGDAFLGHPGLVAVPEAVRCEAELDRKPAGQRSAIGDGLDPAASGWAITGGRAVRERVLRAARNAGWPGSDRVAGPGGCVGDDQPGHAPGCWLVTTVAGGAEDPAGVVAAAVVAAVGAEEYIPAAAAVLGRAGAPPAGMVLELVGEQAVQEWREVDRELGFPFRAAVGVVLGREPVEPPVELAKLPPDVELARVDVATFQPDRLTPPQAGVGDHDDYRELVGAAGQQRGPLGEQQRFQWRRPRAPRFAFQPAAGAAAAVAEPERGVVGDQWRLGGCGVAQDGAQQGAGGAGGPRRDACAGGQRLLPARDCLGGQRPQRAVTPGGADEPADHVLAVVLGADADVLHGQPAVDPFADRDLPGCRSVQRPSQILASWSHPQVSAADLVSNPDSLLSVPSGSLYFTRQGRGPLPRFSEYAMRAPSGDGR